VTRDDTDGTAAKVVPAPKRGSSDTLTSRPPFGTQNTVERETPPKPPRYRGSSDSRERTAPAAPDAQAVTPALPRGRQAQAPRETAPPAPQQQESRGRGRQREEATAPRNLPGEPANRVYRGRTVETPRVEAPQQRVTPQRESAPQHVPQQQQPHQSRQHGGGGQPQGGGTQSQGGGGGWGRGRPNGGN
jgi:hypothetical protein